MFTYSEQYSLIKDIKVRENTSKSCDCPFCGGKGKLSITNRDGSLLWNCYRASCSVRGVHGVARSTTSIQNKLLGKSIGPVDNSLPLPAIVSSPDHHPRAIDYLTSVHSLDAYGKTYVHIKYAPSEDRVLFFMNNDSGAVGRSLSGKLPKWKSYGDTTGLFTCGTGDIAVVVEDAASACAISNLNGYVGTALLGTNVSPKQKQQLKHYSKVIISLDKDASSKAIKLLSKLAGHVKSVTVVLLEEDLKNLDTQQMEELYNESKRHSGDRLRL